MELGLASIFRNLHTGNAFTRGFGLGYLTATASFGEKQTMSETFGMAAKGGRVLAHLPTLLKFAEMITSSIDDRLDPMPFDQFVRLGEIHGGTKPCPFILNPLVVTPEEWQVCHDMDRKKLLPLPVTIAFCNQLAISLYAEKLACHEAEADVSARLRLKEDHMRLSGLCVATLAAIINPVQTKNLTAATADIGLGQIEEHFPDAMRFGAVIQLHNDMLDMFKDMGDEMRTGMVAPNSLIAQIAARHSGLDECADFSAYILGTMPPQPFFPAQSLPSKLRQGWSDICDEAMTLASMISHTGNRNALKHMISGVPGPAVLRALNRS